MTISNQLDKALLDELSSLSPSDWQKILSGSKIWILAPSKRAVTRTELEEMASRDDSDGSEAQFCLGRELCTAGTGTTIDATNPDFERGITYLQQAADFGGEPGANANMLLGRIYHSFDHPKQDTALAINYFQKAADFGGEIGAEANVLLGFIHYKGENVPKNLSQALQHWEQAAQFGEGAHSARANFQLGVLYAFEEGVAKDIPRSVQYWEQAVTLGNGDQASAEANYNLGAVYRSEEAGITKDIHRARECFTKALEFGGDIGALAKEQLSILQ